MGTKIRVNQNPTDDVDDWDEDYQDDENKKLPRGRRWRDIEDRLEDRRLRRQIEDVFDLRDLQD